MCSALLPSHYQSRKRPAVASCYMKPEPRRKLPEKRERAARLCCSDLITVLSLCALVFLAGGAMAQVQGISLPILSSGLRGTAPVQTPTIEKLTQRPAAESLFSAANLPPIEAIDTEADIRPFLASGVPADLTQAALRRAWSTDPAIRDFIGLSENSWDFNAPSGIPGFGALTTDSPGRLVARKMEESDSLDPERLAADRLTHDQSPVPDGEGSQAPGSAQAK